MVQVPVRLSYLNSDNDDLYKNTYVAGFMAMILKIKMNDNCTHQLQCRHIHQWWGWMWVSPEQCRTAWWSRFDNDNGDFCGKMSNIFYTWHLLKASVTVPTVSSLKEISIAMVTKFSMITLITMVTMMVMRRKMQMVLMNDDAWTSTCWQESSRVAGNLTRMILNLIKFKRRQTRKAAAGSTAARARVCVSKECGSEEWRDQKKKKKKEKRKKETRWTKSQRAGSSWGQAARWGWWSWFWCWSYFTCKTR